MDMARSAEEDGLEVDVRVACSVDEDGLAVDTSEGCKAEGKSKLSPSRNVCRC